MPKYTVNVGGSDYDVDSPDDLNTDQVMDHLSQAGVVDPNAPSMAGSAGRSLARNVLPTWLGGMAGGAAAGAAEGLELGPIGVIGGGLIGGALGIYGASKAQQAAADYINPSEANPLSSASEQKDVETNPYSTELGGLLMFKPNPFKLANALKGTATAEGRNLLRQGYGIQKAISQIPKDAEPLK